ncbi:YbhB/YbcL family Raf kinase inhibitor-like protein [Leucobacter komagatae]|uniref:YbhB/YbcL family Raf kinase inhibitor-like protein n=1 Tax=Leucobacter komagatae TaxID=55969 RepID=UPI003B2283D5
MRLWSTSFVDGSAIPDAHAGVGVGQNLSPALSWSGVPELTQELLLVIEDLDVPLPRPLLHTIALLSPTPTRISGAGSAASGRLLEGELDTSDGVRFVPTRFKRTGYQGPRPLPGHGPHRYDFHLYSLDRACPPARTWSNISTLLQGVSGHVTASGHLRGTMQQN